ncbi:hypothetical protein [Sphingomonas sp.]
MILYLFQRFLGEQMRRFGREVTCHLHAIRSKQPGAARKPA